MTISRTDPGLLRGFLRHCAGAAAACLALAAWGAEPAIDTIDLPPPTRGHTALLPVIDVKLSTDGVRAWTASPCELKAWDLDTGALLWTERVDGACAEITLDDNPLRVTASGQLRVTGGLGIRRILAISPSARYIALEGSSRTVWDAWERRMVTASGNALENVIGFTIDDNAVVQGKRTLDIYDLDSGARIQRLHDSAEPFTGYVSANGQRILLVEDNLLRKEFRFPFSSFVRHRQKFDRGFLYDYPENRILDGQAGVYLLDAGVYAANPAPRYYRGVRLSADGRLVAASRFVDYGARPPLQVAIGPLGGTPTTQFGVHMAHRHYDILIPAGNEVALVYYYELDPVAFNNTDFTAPAGVQYFSLPKGELLNTVDFGMTPTERLGFDARFRRAATTARLEREAAAARAAAERNKRIATMRAGQTTEFRTFLATFPALPPPWKFNTSSKPEQNLSTQAIARPLGDLSAPGSSLVALGRLLDCADGATALLSLYRVPIHAGKEPHDRYVLSVWDAGGTLRSQRVIGNKGREKSGEDIWLNGRMSAVDNGLRFEVDEMRWNKTLHSDLVLDSESCTVQQDAGENEKGPGRGPLHSWR